MSAEMGCNVHGASFNYCFTRRARAGGYAPCTLRAVHASWPRNPLPLSPRALTQSESERGLRGQEDSRSPRALTQSAFFKYF